MVYIVQFYILTTKEMGFGQHSLFPGSRVHAGGLVGILLSPLASVRWIWSLVVSPDCGYNLVSRASGSDLAIHLGLTSSSGFMVLMVI